LERADRELEDLRLAVERIPAPDVDMPARELDHVVTGPRLPAQAKRRDGAGVDDEEILELPGVRHVLVARENEVDAGALQAFDRVARVVDDVALAPCTGDGQQVVVADEHAQVGGRREAVLDPAIAPTSDLAVIEIGL